MSKAILAGALALFVAAMAQGFALQAPISLTPYGGAAWGSGAAPVALTQDSFLVAVAGPDSTLLTADDAMLLVSNVDGIPQISVLATPYLSDWSQKVVRVSATRAVVAGAGPDMAFRTADDLVFLLDGLGSTNTVTPITVGPLYEYDFSKPVAVRTDLLAIAGIGPDATDESADDELIVVSDLGGANTVTRVAAEFLAWIAQPVAFGTSTVVMQVAGPDANAPSADDGVYVFTDLGATNARAFASAPYLTEGRASQAARVGPTSALIRSEGPDATQKSADSGVHLLSDIGGTNQVAPILVPNLMDWSASTPTLVAPGRFVMSSAGPDATKDTADDGIAILDDVGGANSVTHVVLGPMEDTYGMGPVPVSPTTVVVNTDGPDAVEQTLDDRLYIVTDLGGANSVSFLPIPGLDEGRTPRAVAINAAEVVQASGGADGLFGSGADDVVQKIGGIGTAPFVQTLPDGGLDDEWELAHQLELLGGGRGVYVTGGIDQSLTTPDDQIRILSGLDIGRSLTVDKLSIKSSSKGEKASVKASLVLDDFPWYFGHSDVTVSIGNAAETIPASAFVDKGKKVEYKAPKGSGGLISKLTYKAAKGQLAIKAGGTGTGLETTDASHVPVAIEFKNLEDQETYLAEGVVGEQKGSKIKYKAPKN